jgi:isopenicillin N synthase-like dioxygenase
VDYGSVTLLFQDPNGGLQVSTSPPPPSLAQSSTT